MQYSSDADRPVFVVGVPRSGTTLLQTFLEAHPNIALAPETHFLHKLRKSVRHRNAESRFATFWADYLETDRFRRLQVDSGRLARQLEHSGEVSARNAFRALCMLYAERQGKRRWGEKTPAHYAHLDTLLKWFPRASVIVSMRDPRAISHSLLSVYWRRSRVWHRYLEGVGITRLRRVYHDAQVWRSHVRDLVTRRADDDRIMVIRYEDLVRNPEREVRAVMDFLDEPFDGRILDRRARARTMTELEEGGTDAQSAWRARHLATSTGPIRTTHIAKWQTGLSSEEIGLIERVCASEMEDMGYEPLNDPASRSRSALRYWWCHAHWLWRSRETR